MKEHKLKRGTNDNLVTSSEKRRGSSPASLVIEKLLDKYNIRSEKLVDGLSRGSFHFSPKVTLNWINGKSQPRSRGKDALVEFFSAYNPDVSEYWFEAKLSEIVHLLQNDKKTLEIKFPKIFVDSLELQKYSKIFEGNWITKRYAFENTGRIARELLIIHPYKNGVIPVTIYGVTSLGVEQQGGYIEEVYTGQLFVVGEQIAIETTLKNNEKERIRRIDISKPREFQKRRAHWGLVSGYSSIKMEPAASRAFMLRVSDKQITDKIIRKNFIGFRNTSTNDSVLEKILSNDIQKYHVSARPDFVLTISGQDFYENAGDDFFNRMERGIFQKILRTE